MLKPWKYMLFLALAVPAIYAFAPPSLKELAKPRWLTDISLVISTSFAAKPEAEIPAVDPIAAAKVDEDLDYRIAERTKSTEGWRAFLAAHPDGAHAQFARAELDTLTGPLAPSALTVAQKPDAGVADAKPPVGSIPPSSPAPESNAATLASDEICKDDQDRLQRLSNSPTSDGVIRLLIELRCEKLRPQLLSLVEHQEDELRTNSGDSAHDRSLAVSQEPDVSGTNPPLPPTRADEPPNRPRPSIASHGIQPKRHASAPTSPTLPPILLALFGQHPKGSTTVRRTRPGGRVGPNGRSGGGD